MPSAPMRFKRPVLVGVARLDAKAGVGAGGNRVPPVERALVSDRRGSAHERGYGHRWRLARAGFLRRHPLCVASLANGLTVPAEVVDHIVPHHGDMRLFWDSSNWQALSKQVHDSIKQELETLWEQGLLDASLLRLDRPMPKHFPSTY